MWGLHKSLVFLDIVFTRMRIHSPSYHYTPSEKRRWWLTSLTGKCICWMISWKLIAWQAKRLFFFPWLFFHGTLPFIRIQVQIVIEWNQLGPRQPRRWRFGNDHDDVSHEKQVTSLVRLCYYHRKRFICLNLKCLKKKTARHAPSQEHYLKLCCCQTKKTRGNESHGISRHDWLMRK
jgi:hypothetical protein